MTSGQEKERAYSFNPGAHTWRTIDGQTYKYRLGRALFLLKNRFLALILPNLNRSG